MRYINFFLLILFVLYGCDMPNDRVRETYNKSVNCILSTGNNIQKVYFIRVRDINEADKFGPEYYDTVGRLAFLPGARITINNNLFHECVIRADQYSYYRIIKPGLIQPETEYNLNIEYNDEIITGKTTVPGAFSILNYPKDSVYRIENDKIVFNLAWQKSKNSKGYICQTLYYILGNEYFLPHTSYSIPVLTADTSSQITIWNADRSNNSIKYIIKVAAYDENFENYYIKNHQISGVSNTYGVFCSMAVDSIVVNVIK